MKILYAINHPRELEHLKLQLFNIDELTIIPPKNWLVKRMKTFKYEESFVNKGMLYPIAVSTHNHEWVKERFARKNLPHIVNGEVKPGLYVQTGNKRVLWAKENGYNQIEGYFINTKEDKARIRSVTHIKHERIPR